MSEQNAVLSMVPPLSAGREQSAAFLEIAGQIERQGIELYNSLASEIHIRDISGIFRFLAREEQRHSDIFESWRDSAQLPLVEPTQVVLMAKEAFQTILRSFREAGLPASVPTLNYSDAYEKALAAENQSIELYEEQLLLLEDTPGTVQQRAVLNGILTQEREHAELISALMELNRFPGEWLENAEFYHLDEF